MADFVYGAFDLAGEFLPLDEAEGSAADGERGFDLGAVEFGAEAFAGFLAGRRGGFHFLFELL